MGEIETMDTKYEAKGFLFNMNVIKRAKKLT